MENKAESETGEQAVRACHDVPGGRTSIEMGYIRIHCQLAEQVRFSDVYYALRRHETGEWQAGIPESLITLAASESQSSGLVISYHVTEDAQVFGVVTNPVANQTVVRLAPLDDLEKLALTTTEE